MSLLALSEGDRMELPPGIGVIRDIQIAPSGIHAPGKLALMASAGKKLTLLRFGSPITHALMWSNAIFQPKLGKGFSHVLFSLFFSDCSSLHVLTLDVYMCLVTDMSHNHLTRIVTVWRAIMWSYHTHYRCDLKQFPGCLCLEFVWLHSIQQDDFMYWRRVFWMQSPSWACAWDLCNPNQIYTGLQVRSL